MKWILILLVFFALPVMAGEVTKFELYEDSAGKVVRLATEESRPFLFQGWKVLDENHKEDYKIRHRENYRSSIRRFSSVKDCLTREARKMPKPDLIKVDWDKIDTNEDAAVCLFRIASSYATPKDMEEWMKAQGFKTRNGYSTIQQEKIFGVGGAWSVKNNGVKFSAHLLDRWWLNSMSHGTSFSASYDKNDNPYSTSVTHTFE